MATCRSCGQQTRWVEVDGERIALNSLPRYNGPYVLDPEDSAKARKVEVPGHAGYDRHADTCPANVRDREKRERVL